jgi:hypothetical protein
MRFAPYIYFHGPVWVPVKMTARPWSKECAYISTSEKQRRYENVLRGAENFVFTWIQLVMKRCCDVDRIFPAV